MKTLKIVSLFAILLFFVQMGFAQTATTEKIKVSGECGMCKKKIEKAAKDAGASYAVWSSESKILEVKYTEPTNSDIIQKSVADAGYDTPKYRATDAAYEKLSPCCHYERTSVTSQDTSASAMHCGMKEGKCTDMASCKGKDCKDHGDTHMKASEGKIPMNCSDSKGDKGAKAEKGSKSCCSKKASH